MILTQQSIDYLLSFIRQRPDYLRFYRYAHVPDEIALQTIVLNSPWRERVVNDSLKFIDYRTPNYQLVSNEHFIKLQASHALFARKFDITASKALLDRIDQELR